MNAHTIFINANIFTANAAQPFAQAVAIRNNRIAFVGSNADALAWRSDNTRVIDAQNNTLLPGINDAHYHLMHGSMYLDGMSFEDVHKFETVVHIVKHFAAEHPEREWLEGYQLPYNAGPNHSPLTRQHLDSIVSDRPLFILAYDGHTAWANTNALERAGILRGGECGANSEIVLDEHGEATGELREPGAFHHISKLIPVPDMNRKRALLHKGLRQAAELGVTSVQNMDARDDLPVLASALEDVGELTLRVYLPFDIKPTTPFEALATHAVEFRSTFQSELVRAGSVKFFMDGVIEGFTGLLLEPYADNPHTCGDANYTPEHFNRMAVEADRLGFQIFVHAIGDLAVRRTLDGYQLAREKNGKRDSRHRVEHIELIHPDDIPRFAELDAIASMQPLHCPLNADGVDVWTQRVGEARWHLSFAWETLRNANARLVFGSDWPVVTQNPFRGIHMAVNRKPWRPHLPEQKQTLVNTLMSYTRDAAYAEFQEHHKGQVRADFLADLVLVNADMFAAPPETIAEMKPLVTMCDGRIVYEA
mgnify:CR=1 FL=1